MNRKLDTDTQVFFYEQEFYVLSNFSAFTLQWRGFRFDTSEAAYHWEKFDFVPWADGEVRTIHNLIPKLAKKEDIQDAIRKAPSAHEAFYVAQRNAEFVRPDWKEVRLNIMENILQAKAEQHEYVRRKLLETGDRELVEDSWRDSYWGWGEDHKGQNMLGKLWMKVRDRLREVPND